MPPRLVPPPAGLPAEIWVREKDLERAKQVLEEVEAAPETLEPAAPPESTDAGPPA